MRDSGSSMCRCVSSEIWPDVERLHASNYFGPCIPQTTTVLGYRGVGTLGGYQETPIICSLGEEAAQSRI
ncbi:hypothetical protein I7I50_01319 [Histoplasma capsulatum G186AR]|uniref:Uncharacterized protein n=1 Tax=Ajellomyces capsulatus TaxID=5037 RepID=A0A8H7YUG6_AJECA|nr:hypothetical protein I7I52_08854 [Histoplasma capsulatum]QSS73227.1 hypothetical protein I7I50_01319 [Histoplasma capsulatum G186AR]